MKTAFRSIAGHHHDESQYSDLVIFLVSVLKEIAGSAKEVTLRLIIRNSLLIDNIEKRPSNEFTGITANQISPDVPE
jgi:hypothetical protein